MHCGFTIKPLEQPFNNWFENATYTYIEIYFLSSKFKNVDVKIPCFRKICSAE